MKRNFLTPLHSGAESTEWLVGKSNPERFRAMRTVVSAGSVSHLFVVNGDEFLVNFEGDGGAILF